MGKERKSQGRIPVKNTKTELIQVREFVHSKILMCTDLSGHYNYCRQTRY